MFSLFAWIQASPLFMPEEEKGSQSPSAILGCRLQCAPGLPLILPLWTPCSLQARDSIDLMCGDSTKWALYAFLCHLLIVLLNLWSLSFFIRRWPMPVKWPYIFSFVKPVGKKTEVHVTAEARSLTDRRVKKILSFISTYLFWHDWQDIWQCCLSLCETVMGIFTMFYTKQLVEKITRQMNLNLYWW